MSRRYPGRSSSLSLSSPIALGLALTALGLSGGCALEGSPSGGGQEKLGTEESALTGIATSPIATSPGVTTLAATPDYQQLSVSMSATSGDDGTTKAINDQFFVIQGRTAIAKTALPAATQSALTSSMATSDAKVGEDEIIIFPKSLSDQYLANVGKPVAFSFCSDEDKTFVKDYSVDKVYTLDKGTESGSFEGSAHVTAGVTGRLIGTINYTIKRHWYFGCIPYAVIHKVEVQGAATVSASAKIDGTFDKKWNWSTTLAEPTLGTVTLPGVPIPVTFTLPVRAGIDASAHAELHAEADFSALGGFDVVCRSSGCSGTRSGVANFNPKRPFTAALSAKVDATPWVEAGLHAKILADSLASAEVVIRASVPTELNGYAGNTCGDADNDGVNEWVSGLTVDAKVDLAIRAKAEIIGQNLGPWTWDVWNKHVAFWSVNGGMLDPMFYGAAPVGSLAPTMHGKMRPCWPYKDAMTYRIDWSDGATTSFTGDPTVLFSQSHAFAAVGAKPIKLTAVSDAQGRTLGTSATRSVNLSSNVFVYNGGGLLLAP